MEPCWSLLAAALGVTEFTIAIAMILVTLGCAAYVWSHLRDTDQNRTAVFSRRQSCKFLKCKRYEALNETLPEGQNFMLHYTEFSHDQINLNLIIFGKFH